MIEFPQIFQLPFAEWVDLAVNWLLANWEPFFNAISSSILYIFLNIERFLTWLPWFIVTLLTGLIAWRSMRSWWAGLIMTAFLVLIGSLGYWELTMTTLTIIITAVVISLAFGILLGILITRSNLVESIIRPGLDAMQSVPSFVYLIPALMFFGLGIVPAVFATIIYAIPPVIRLTNVGIRQVPKSAIETAQAFGSTGWQILLNVQIPIAKPAIMVGINQTTMMALSMAILASLIGARGLGLEGLSAIEHGEIGRSFAAGLSIILLAIVIDRITHVLAIRQQHKIA
ncbi:ABC transporter permease [Chloroflexota bacterium]